LLVPPACRIATTIMPTIAAPNSPYTTIRTVERRLPENVSSIAPIIATIGSIISACVHCRPPATGISGGASSSSSPAGSSGAGCRAGRFTITVAMESIVGPPGAGAGGLAGRCRRPPAGAPGS
jgi:hypothetical protein